MKSTLSFALLVLIVSGSSVRADPVPTFVWFEATPLTATAGVFTQGVQGGDLVLQCDTSAGPTTCQWDITVRMSSVVQFGALGTDLFGDTDKHSISAIQPGDFPSDASFSTAVNSGGVLASFKEINIPLISGPNGLVFDPTDGAPGDYILATFTLTTEKAFGDTLTDGIDARINDLLWSAVNPPGTPTPEAIIQFGDAAPINGGIQGGIAEDVIRVRNIPEPTTLVLLTIALFIPARRRH